MIPPITTILLAWPALTALVAGRIYSSGDAPESTSTTATALPYVAWSMPSSNAQLNLSELPDSDDQIIQVDCYALAEPIARQIAKACRDALEQVSDVTLGPVNFDREPDTKLYRWMMQAEFWPQRND